MNITQRILTYVIIAAAILAILWATQPSNPSAPRGIFLAAVKQLPAKLSSASQVQIFQQQPTSAKLLGTISMMQQYVPTTPALQDNIRHYVQQLAAAHGANVVYVQYFVATPHQQMPSYILQAQAYRQS